MAIPDPLLIANAALKTLYLPTIREQLFKNNVLLNQIESSSVDVVGTKWVMSLHLGRNQGLGARGEMVALPGPGRERVAEVEGVLKRNYGVFQVSGPVIRASARDEGSYVRAIESAQTGTVESLQLDVERQVWGTSDGVIAATGVTSASTTVVHSATVTQRRHLVKGLRIDIGTVASPTAVASNREITAILSSTTFTISGAAVTTATTDRIFRSGNGGAVGGVGQQEVTGIQSLVSGSGTVHNLSAATEPDWASYEDATSGAITDARITQALDEISIRNSGMSQDLVAFGSHATVRTYGATLTSLKRFNDTTTLKGGFGGLTIGSGGSGEAKLAAVRDAPIASLWFINTNHLKEHKASDWEWMEEDGAVLQRSFDSAGRYDAYDATLFKYFDVATDRRNSHGLIKNITGTNE